MRGRRHRGSHEQRGRETARRHFATARTAILTNAIFPNVQISPFCMENTSHAKLRTRTRNGIEGKDGLFFCLVGGDRPEPIKDARPFIKFTSKSHSEFNNSRAITDASPKIVFSPPYLFVSIAGDHSVGVEQRWWGNVPEHSSIQD